MLTVEQKFRKEIEVEQLWAVTEHGGYVFASMLLVSTTLVFGLWTTANHDRLLYWFALLSAINLFKWLSLHHYHHHKERLFTNLNEFKGVTLFFAVLTGLCWSLSVIWFLNPSQPGNALLIGVTLSIEIIGAMLTWTSYIPAILAISLPPATPLIFGFFLEGTDIFIASAIIFGMLTCFGVTSSKKLSGTLRQALLLNYENVLLRQESEETSLLLKTTLENMHQGICMSDQSDNLRMWNKPFVHMLDDMGSHAEMGANLKDILSVAKPPILLNDNTRLEYHTSMGHIFEVQQSYMPEGGRVLTFTDITELVNREQSLNKARREAELANAAKTRFLAAASHDLRQPIHALGLFFGELSSRVHNSDTAKVIGQIEDSINTINSMLNALLDISKLDAGVVKPNVETVDLNELFLRLQNEFQILAKENNNELRIRSTKALVVSDSTLLESMLRNLLGNATGYTENGRILLAARRRGHACQIEVYDTGCGIPNDQLDEIFSEFHQLHNAARDRQKGLGLGLSIVNRLAKLLQHGIKVKSQPGKGSCFALTVPISLQEDKQQFSNPQNSDNLLLGNRLAGCCILVLDDDALVLEGMRGLLTQWGCRVLTASNQTRALAQLKECKQQINLLMIDYRLENGASGLAVATHLQQQSGYPFAVLVITGDTDPERLREANASGFPLLHKPVVPAKLRSRLLDIISTYKEST